MDPASVIILVSSLLSLLIGIGSQVKNDQEVKDIEERVKQGKASYADALLLLNKIQGASKGKSYGQRSKIASALNNLTHNQTLQSSGLAEKLIGDLRSRVENVVNQIDSYRNAADVESQMSESAAGTFASLSEKEKAGAKYRSMLGIKPNSSKEKSFNKLRDKYQNMDRTDRDKFKNTVGKIRPDMMGAIEKGLDAWNEQNAAGRAGQELENHAKKASELYEKANALGEKYV